MIFVGKKEVSWSAFILCVHQQRCIKNPKWLRVEQECLQHQHVPGVIEVIATLNNEAAFDDQGGNGDNQHTQQPCSNGEHACIRRSGRRGSSCSTLKRCDALLRGEHFLSVIFNLPSIERRHTMMQIIPIIISHFDASHSTQGCMGGRLGDRGGASVIY